MIKHRLQNGFVRTIKPTTKRYTTIEGKHWHGGIVVNDTRGKHIFTEYCPIARLTQEDAMNDSWFMIGNYQVNNQRYSSEVL